jgi:hypothetical protein
MHMIARRHLKDSTHADDVLIHDDGDSNFRLKDTWPRI